MHFDDRLATVLRQSAGGGATARIQYKQLLDLLGTLPVEAQGPAIDAACKRLGELKQAIGASERAAMLRDPGLRLRNPRLVSLLAADEPAVAAAAIERAQLREEEWIDLAPALPLGALSLVRQRRDLGPRAANLFDRLGMAARGLPPAGAAAAPQAGHAPGEPVPGAFAPSAKGGAFGEIVKRIEDFRKARKTGDSLAASNLSPQLPLSDDSEIRPAPRLRAFDFATDSGGCIVWSDPGMAPMAVGLRLAAHDAGGSGLAEKLRLRQPVSGAVVDIAGSPAIAGIWLIDAAPGFDPQDGRFTGHAGRMRRPDAAPADAAQAGAGDNEADRMRQVLHELRTPVSAIQGFAEVIQQQLFGPAPHEYRALAASIAADAARMLAGFEELDRLARLEGGRAELDAGSCDFGDVLAGAVAHLRHFTESRGSGFRLSAGEQANLTVPVARAEAERLAWRLLATLAGAANPGEVLELSVSEGGEDFGLTLQLPASLAAQAEGELMNALAGQPPKALSAGMFGTGFSLRLAAAEARAAGGSLAHRGQSLELRLPRLTGDQPKVSTSELSGATPG